MSSFASTRLAIAAACGPRRCLLQDVDDGFTASSWIRVLADFRYGGGDSVLVVDREAFDGCNATEPVARFAGGATTVPLGRPGFFCFISGAPGHCDGGQRLIVRVMVHPAPGAPVPAPSAAAAATSHPGASASGPGASSGAAAVAAGGAGAAVAAAAMGVLAGLVLLLQ